MKGQIVKTNKNFVCLCTCKDLTEAERIAKALVTKKLVACANIVGGIRSFYRWKGKLCKDSETLLILKGYLSKKVKLTNEIINLHSYEVPEIIFLKIDSGSKEYLEWMSNSDGTIEKAAS